MENNYYPFVNLPLPYEYNALEPFIDEETMRLHHDKHLQTYIDNLNGILKNEPELWNLSLEELIKNADKLPKNLQTPVRNNAGGVYNHRFFFEGIAPPAQNEPDGKFTKLINRRFGNMADFRQELKKAALSVFGSGYAWLVLDKGRLEIVTTPNQNSPIENGMCPILCLDVWEHAYYLKHHNLRGDYIEDFFRVMNPKTAGQKLWRCLFSSNI